MKNFWGNMPKSPTRSISSVVEILVHSFAQKIARSWNRDKKQRHHSSFTWKLSWNISSLSKKTTRFRKTISTAAIVRNVSFPTWLFVVEDSLHPSTKYLAFVAAVCFKFGTPPEILPLFKYCMVISIWFSLASSRWIATLLTTRGLRLVKFLQFA